MLRAGSKRRTRGFHPAEEVAPEAPLSPVVGEPIVFAQPAPDAVVEAPSTSDGRVRCARSHKKSGWRCKHMFVPKMTPFGKLQTRCERCSTTSIRNQKTEKGRVSMKKYTQSGKGKVMRKRAKEKYRSTEKCKATEKAWRESETGKEICKKSEQKYRNSLHGRAKMLARIKAYQASERGKALKKKYRAQPHIKKKEKQWRRDWYFDRGGKESTKRRNATEAARAARKRWKTSEAGLARRRAVCESMRHKLGLKISKMCRDGDIESISALQATGCASAKELRAHFESTFEPWMNWSNRGAHKAGGSSGTWQTGHRLACAFYDDSNPADIRRCWNKANLFAQDSDENHTLSVTMPDDTTLERLRALNLLPCAWNGIVPPVAQRAEMERVARLPIALR